VNKLENTIDKNYEKEENWRKITKNWRKMEKKWRKMEKNGERLKLKIYKEYIYII
jgi:hypothetical protein